MMKHDVASGTARPIEILLVEDNPADARLTMEGLKEAKVTTRLHAVEDGDAATDFLRKIGEFKDAETPDIILLDLNMPGKDGREVLKEIKTDEKLRQIPVVVMSSSEAEADIVQSYQDHANCYVVKPVAYDGFVKIIHELDDFWFSIVKLPSRAGDKA